MLGLTFHYFHITELLKADYRCTILKALQKNKNIKENLCRIEEYFHDFFFSFALRLTLIVYLRNSRWFICFQMETGVRRQTSAVDRFCVQYAQQNGGRVGAFKNSDFFFFLTHNSLYQSKVCSSRSSVSSVNSCLVTENTTFKSNLTSCGF